MTEWGVFNAEGLLEGDLWSREQAEAAARETYSEEDDVSVEHVCDQCRGDRADDCQTCETDDEEDD